MLEQLGEHGLKGGNNMEIIQSISESGILIVIAGVFLYTYISDKKNNVERDAKYNESLRLLSESNTNIAKALDLLNVNSVNNDKLLREHDERAILINERLIEIKNCVDKKKAKKSEWYKLLYSDYDIYFNYISWCRLAIKGKHKKLF